MSEQPQKAPDVIGNDWRTWGRRLVQHLSQTRSTLGSFSRVYLVLIRNLSWFDFKIMLSFSASRSLVNSSMLYLSSCLPTVEIYFLSNMLAPNSSSSFDFYSITFSNWMSFLRWSNTIVCNSPNSCWNFSSDVCGFEISTPAGSSPSSLSE